MTATDLVINVGAILAVIPAIHAYGVSGLLAAVGVYVGLLVALTVSVVVLQLILLPFFNRKD